MTRTRAEQTAERLDWSAVDLAVFDLDGTLYAQRKLRQRMLAQLLRDAIATGSLRNFRVLRQYRLCREQLSERGGDFLDLQFTLPAKRCGVSVEEVRKRVEDWINWRPLVHLGSCREPGIDTLFEALRLSGRTIAVLSDYPADEKLKALGLQANFVVSAEDPDVRRLKPDPRGLEKVVRLAGTSPTRAVMIGDRDDRDGEIARRLGMPALIRNAPEGYLSFRDAVFQPVLAMGYRPVSTRNAAHNGQSL